MEDVMMVMREGEKNRTVACTKMNTNKWGRLCVDLNIYLVVSYTLLLTLYCITTYKLSNYWSGQFENTSIHHG